MMLSESQFSGDKARQNFVAAFFAFVVLAATSMAPPARAGQTLNAVTGLNFFDKLALMRGHRAGGEFPGKVRKFHGTVTISFSGAADQATRRQLQEIADDLTELTGVDFKLGEAGNHRLRQIRVRFLEPAAMEEKYGKNHPACFCRNFGYDGRLYRAEIDVHLRYTDCLQHEFMHAIGFDNHWTGEVAVAGMPSVLAMRNTPARAGRFSRFDRFAIRLLYDWRLPAGTPRDVALTIARRVVGDHVEDQPG